MPTDEVTDEFLPAYVWQEAREAWRSVDPKAQIASGFVLGNSSAAIEVINGALTVSEQRGYDRAIAEVVAWLRGRPVTLYRDAPRLFADNIEAGEHKP